MAKWQSTLDVVEAWKAAQNDEISIQELASIVHKKLLDLPALGVNEDQGRLELAESFEDLSADPKATSNEFDYLWSYLYDWADQIIGPKTGPWNQKRACWVKIF